MKIDPKIIILDVTKSPIAFDPATGAIGNGAPLTLGVIIDVACRCPNPVRVTPQGALPPEPLTLDETKRRYDWIDKVALGAEVDASAQDLDFLQNLIVRAWTNVAIAGAAVRILDQKPQWSSEVTLGSSSEN